MNKTIRNTLALAAFATATACSSTTTETVITGNTTGTTTGTTGTYTGTTSTTGTSTTSTTTTPEDDYLVPYTWSIAAYFGYDAADGTLKGATYGSYEFPAEIVVSVNDERYYDASNAMYTCDVTISVPSGTVVPAWVGETLAYDDKGATIATFLGIAQEKGYKTSEECGMELDPMSGFSTAAEILGDGWTLGVAEMSDAPDIEEALMGYFTEDEWAADWAPFVLAGGVVFEDYYEKGAYNFYDTSYGFAYETNDSLELQVDASGYLTSLQSAQAASTLPTAWYEIYSFYGYYLN
jgi:hypothetical protein